LHSQDASKAFEVILEKGVIGEIYNIGCDEKMEYSILDLAKILIQMIHHTHDYDKWIEYVEDRPFNDQRYYISNKKLRDLFCGNNDILELPEFNEELQILYCYNNSLSFLPEFNENLEVVFCSNNRLTSLPRFSKNLHTLYCNQNFIKEIPYLNEKLIILHCQNNLLTKLPALNYHLQILFCHNNQINYIPPFNEYLRIFNASYNQIYSLPDFPDTIEQIYIYHNPINRIIPPNHSDFSNMKKNIKIMNKFRFLFYSLKCKKQLMKILWEKVREPLIMKKYHPSKLLDYLNEEKDMDEFLLRW